MNTRIFPKIKFQKNLQSTYWSKKTIKKMKLQILSSFISLYVYNCHANFNTFGDEQFFLLEMQNNRLTLSKNSINFTLQLLFLPQTFFHLNDTQTEEKDKKKVLQENASTIRKEKITRLIFKSAQSERSRGINLTRGISIIFCFSIAQSFDLLHHKK